MTAAALALISSIAGAFANLLARRVADFAQARDYLAVNFGLMFILLLPAAPFFWQLELRLEALAVLLAAALIDLAANYFYFRSFEALDAVTASSILSLSPAVSLFFVPIFQMGLGVHWSGYAGILLVSAGLVLLSRAPLKDPSMAPLRSTKAICLPLAAALLYGLNVFVIKLLFQNNWCSAYTYYLLRALFVAGIWYILFKPDHSWLTRGTLWFSAGRVVIVIAQWMFLLAALNLGNPAGVKALADTSPLFVLIFSGLVMGERINKWKVLGVLVLVVGMGLVALSGA